MEDQLNDWAHYQVSKDMRKPAPAQGQLKDKRLVTMDAKVLMLVI
jgi:hypothetical protein